MRYLGQDELTQVMGIGYLGEVRQGPNGNLYQWVQGVDGLGNPVGFWRAFRRLARRIRPFLRRALPVVQQFAPLIPGVGPAAAALRAATPLLRQALPVIQQVAPLIPGATPAAAALTAAMPAEATAAPAEAATAGWGLGQDELTQVMGLGYHGEVRQGPDGNLYQWVEGYDGLGNPIGFWRALRRLGRRLRPFLRRALPIAQTIAPFIPGVGPAVAAGLRVATPILQRAGVAGNGGLGALYQAPDGTLYQVQGLAQDDELRGLAEDEELRGLEEDEELRGLGEEEELRGFAEDEELRGFAEDEELRGLAEDEELRGFDEDEEMRGLAEDEELRGLDQGYVREPGTSGLEAYVPQTPPQTRWFTAPAQPPEMWRPLW